MFSISPEQLSSPPSGICRHHRRRHCRRSRSRSDRPTDRPTKHSRRIISKQLHSQPEQLSPDNIATSSRLCMHPSLCAAADEQCANNYNLQYCDTIHTATTTTTSSSPRSIAQRIAYAIHGTPADSVGRPRTTLVYTVAAHISDGDWPRSAP